MQLSGILSIGRYAWGAQCVTELLAGAPSSVVADIGTGDGPMRDPVRAANATWHGYDLSPLSADVTRWDLDYPSPEGSVRPGIALLLDVLEHCNNPWMAVRNISDFLLPGGFLVLTMPNPRFSRSRMWALAKGFPLCFNQADLDGNHHVFTPWPHIIERLLHDSGFEILQYVTLDGPTIWPGAPYNLRYPLRVAVAIANKLIERHDPTACGLSYGVLAKKL